MNVVRFLYGHRKPIAAGLTALVALWGILRVLIPGSFCHDVGYVVGSVVALMLVSLMLAEETVRRSP